MYEIKNIYLMASFVFQLKNEQFNSHREGILPTSVAMFKTS